jgi:translation initiation factor IF-2
MTESSDAPAEPLAAAAAGDAPAEPAKFVGLGKAVVMPPPGYDPSNPLAYRRQQEANRAAQVQANENAAATTATATAAGPGKRWGRREVQPANDAARRRGRRTAPAQPRYDNRRNRRGRRKRVSGPKQASPQAAAHKRKVRVDHVISVGNLAQQLSVKPALVIRTLMDLGQMASITEMLDIETATLIANEFEYDVENVGFIETDYLQEGVEDEQTDGESRPPVVTIMGHVDHGKTTLLDALRNSRVAAGEAGGITQHIGAYQVESGMGVITFLDTPGHQAFTAMRAQGAGVTDIVILVVAQDDGVQPQTVEAINHAKAAGVPVIVAINKMDKVGANADNIKQRLSEHELIPEDWGGETMMLPVSALKAEGLDALLESVSLQAEVLGLTAQVDAPGEGTVIEAKMERGKGAVASVLVQHGTLKRGDHVVLGAAFGRVRAMLASDGTRLKEAGPSTPVEVFGLSGLPMVGDTMNVVANEKNARKLAEHRARIMRENAMMNTRRKTAEDLFAAAAAEHRERLLIILKTDVQGSLQALRGAIEKIEFVGTEPHLLHAAVGPISESDVNLAAANGALLLGFNVAVDAKARTAANQQGVETEIFKVIYDLIDRVSADLKGLMAPVYAEVRQGTIEVRALFRISRFGTIAGSYVIDGKVGRGHAVKVLRGGSVIWEGRVSGLRRFKDDVREVSAGYECGVSLDGFNELEEGDLIETYSEELVEQV